MKKAKESDELRSEYKRVDFGRGVREKYFESFQKGADLVLLSPDAAKAFPTEKAVNEALRFLSHQPCTKSTSITRCSTGHAKKVKAIEEGILYQSIISMLIHKYSEGKISINQ